MPERRPAPAPSLPGEEYEQPRPQSEPVEETAPEEPAAPAVNVL
jgi:hypothetical protein